MPDKSKLLWLERVLFVSGVAAAVAVAYLNVPAVIARVRTPALQSASDGAVIPSSALGGAYLKHAGSDVAGTKIGTISVAKLHLVAPIVEGVDDSELRQGVGHVPGSATSGGLGNMVLAAHRDTIFRPLRSIQKGMDIRVDGPEGAFHYQVDSLQIVSPDRLDILDISDRPEVTLITCYPFNFIGHAPMRFVVKAHLVSAAPDTSAL